MRKLMAYPNDTLVVPEETLEDRMKQLLEMEKEYAIYKKAFRKKHENLTASIKSLRNIITAEVIANGKTAIIDGMKAEFIPTVHFMKPKKEQNND